MAAPVQVVYAETLENALLVMFDCILFFHTQLQIQLLSTTPDSIRNKAPINLSPSSKLKLYFVYIQTPPIEI